MKVTTAAVQMNCSRSVEENIAKADKLVRKAAGEGANIILLPELFERQYFCQERRYDYYDFAKPLEENDAVMHFRTAAKELGVVLPVSFYERDVNVLYNSAAVIDRFSPRYRRDPGSAPAMYQSLAFPRASNRSPASASSGQTVSGIRSSTRRARTATGNCRP